MRKISLLTFALAGLMTLTLLAGDDDWPRWLGPRSDGISKETGLLESWPDDGPKRLWSVPAGQGYSSPVAADGKIYMFSMENKRDTLLCVDENGKQVWKQSYDAGWTGQYPGTRATPAIEGGFIYTFGGMGDLVCRKLADGAQVWRTNVLKEIGGKSQKWGEASSPRILGDLILVQAGQGGNFAVAVNKKDGKIAWKSEKGLASYADIVPIEVDGRNIAIVFAGKAVFGLDATTGKTLWSEPWVTSWDVNAATPVYRDGHLFVTSGYNHGCMMLKLTGTTAKKLWEKKEPQSKFAAPILDGDHLYVNSAGKLMCLKWPSGEVAWSSPELRLGGHGGALLRAGDKLIALSESGMLALIHATGDGAKVISRTQLFRGSENWSTPIIYRGRLYVKGPSELVCLDIKAAE